MTLLCVDGAMAARPLPVAMAAAVVASQDAAPKEILPPPDLRDAADAPVAAEPMPEAEELFVEKVANEPVVFADETDDAVSDKLISWLEGVTSMSGDFTQIAPSGTISSGRFYLRRPGQLRFEYDPPTPLLVVASGGLVYVQDEALETTDSYPVGKTPLKFLLKKSIDRDDAKVVAVDRGVDNVAVTFASDDEETEGELTLIASAPEFALKRWIIRDLQGGITVVTLENVKSDIRLANNLFAPPEAGGRFLDR